jgi:hypothetical protein
MNGQNEWVKNEPSVLDRDVLYIFIQIKRYLNVQVSISIFHPDFHLYTIEEISVNRIR